MGSRNITTRMWQLRVLGNGAVPQPAEEQPKTSSEGEPKNPKPASSSGHDVHRDHYFLRRWSVLCQQAPWCSVLLWPPFMPNIAKGGVPLSKILKSMWNLSAGTLHRPLFFFIMHRGSPPNRDPKSCGTV